MHPIKYYPILKWKKGEQCALHELKAHPDTIIPVIEIIDEVTPQDFFDCLQNCYNAPIIFDTLRCDDSRELLIRFTSYAEQHSINAWPLIYSSEVYELLNSLSPLTNHVVIKAPIPEDIEGYPLSTILSYLNSNINLSKVSLMLDAGEVLNSKDANYTLAFYKDILTNLSTTIPQLSNVIISLTSFPDQLDVESGQTQAYPRYDILIFKKLVQNFSDYRLDYSDYGVTKFTETELDFRYLKYGVLPKIKYTTESDYYVYKGKKDHINGLLNRSYIDMCKELITKDYYSGKDFSYGDSAIYDKATSVAAKPGNSTQWVTYCANHHLTFLLEQLSTLHVF